MALDWNAVRMFLATARNGSLRATADRLGVNHATVARALDGLERQLGTRLFTRSRSGLTLTQPGEDLLDTARRMEREAEAARTRLAGLDDQPRGPVRISVPPFLAFRFLAPAFAAFGDRYPDIDLSLQVTNRPSDLGRFEADVAIRAAFSVDQDVVGRRLIRYAKTVYASPAYLAARPPLAVGDGAGTTWLGWRAEDPAWVPASPFPKAGLRHVLPELVLHIEAAAMGMGITYLPCFIGDAEPRLTRVPAAPVVDDRSLWLLLPSDLRRTARVRAVVDFMADAILAQRPLLRGAGR